MVGASVIIIAAALVPRASAQPALHWLSSWSPSEVQGVDADPYETMAFPTSRANEQSVRTAVVVTAPGRRVRVVLSNRFGDAPLRIGHVQVARTESGPSLVSGSSQSATFHGNPDVVVPAGADALSDPVDLVVSAGEQLSLSVHVRSSGRVTFHKMATSVSYVTEPGRGDVTGDESGSSYTRTSPSWFWLAGVQAESPWAGTVVALGDSITDGYLMLPDQQETWPAVLASRLASAASGQRRAVVNAGITGNEVTGSVWSEYGPSAVARLAHDVLELGGVSNVIVFEGTNDLGNGVTVSRLIASLRRIVLMARARGLRVIGATLTPRRDSRWTPAMEADRETVNDWIRASGTFDRVFDFDRVLRDPADPHRLNPAYDTDGLHPNPLGLRVLADSVNLADFA